MADPATIYDALALQQQYYQQSDPFNQAAAALGGMQPYLAESSIGEAIAAGALQGLGAGVMSGIGKQTSHRKFTDFRQRWAEMTPEQRMEDPEMAPLQLLVERQKAAMLAKRAEKYEDADIDMMKSAYSKGMMRTRDGGVAPVPGYGEIEATRARDTAYGSAIGGYGADLEYKPALEASVTAAREAATEPYRVAADQRAYAKEYGIAGERGPWLKDVDDIAKRLESNPVIKEMPTVEVAVKSLAKAMRDPSAVSDVEFVYSAVHAIEPGMAVKEGEQATIRNAQSIPENFKGLMMRALGGEAQLNQETRRAIFDLVGRRYEVRREAFMDYKQGAVREAVNRGAPEDRAQGMIFRSDPAPLDQLTPQQSPQKGASAPPNPAQFGNDFNAFRQAYREWKTNAR